MRDHGAVPDIRADTLVGEVQKGPLVVIDPAASLRQAAEAMRRSGIGALPVGDAVEIQGIVSERDLVRALADGLDVDATPVAEVMSANPRYLTEGDSLATAADVMITAGVRHLPVFDEGQPVGIVSIRDVARAVLR
jgi:CBS domain-containing protein